MTIQAKAKKSKGKRSQWIMLGFFPLIVIGGLFYPLLGYLMPLMMAFAPNEWLLCTPSDPQQ
ncbi:hypothetical protein HPC62_11470 [Thermoleptolyngbya sichuanensis A183]|uniref:Uncharacterized protein n=1 Tax=Thermoleptolyngbya sichuanensis A183 TaxID=2737172 RepID=A0A6M8BEP1_9CYAN|nr:MULTISPECIES: hypothetical protein [Thermoleptolyngbya]QKD82716.1 hypothetical protein HPC62_11470 [Thermoleptolyngbya sichuanensis A183]